MSELWMSTMPIEPFKRRTGIIAAIFADNVDTDVIMPKIFLKGIDRSGLDKGLFHDLRFGGDGELHPEFVLNQPPWDKAEFLVTGANFGCGSSREHAVWGFLQFGIKAIIAPSFAGIFFDNCARNGLLAIEVDDVNIQILTEHAQAGEAITIDLDKQTIETSNITIDFKINERRKRMLLSGLDAIGMTLEWRDEIKAFQSEYHAKYSWLT